MSIETIDIPRWLLSQGYAYNHQILKLIKNYKCIDTIEMDTLIKQFHDTKDSKTEEYEFEAQFKTGDVTKLQYNQVIQWLLLAGFKMETTKGTDLLRIIQHSIRTELTGIDSIRHFCQTDELISPKYIQKESIGYHRIDDYWTKLSLSKETKLDHAEPSGPKTYRLMNRVRLVSEKYPFYYDCSIVRTTNTLKELFTSPPKYEIEVEFTRGKELRSHIQRAITYALRGFQRSNYPIGREETLAVQKAYETLTQSKKFIGPRPISMQSSNLTGKDNIYENFTVTEKTDGERKMLFTTRQRAYFIVSSRLEVVWTGIVVDAKNNNTLLDGEHVTVDKHHERINSYFVFDLYYYHGKDKRALPFLLSTEEDSRWNLMNRSIKGFNPTDMVISVKGFSLSTPDSCKALLNKIKDGEFPYETDGLIFTPTLYGVGMTSTVHSPPADGSDWTLNLKWKPEKDNTIDFLVHFKEDAYKSGATHASTYKKVNLLVGFSHRDVFSNPIHSIFEGYEVRPPPAKPVLFNPCNPAVPDSHVTHLSSRDDKTYTEKGEVIEHGRIVEFRYDKTRELDKRWIPLRVRWDKTVPNGFTTAASNWFTIQYPITEKMLCQQEHEAVETYYADDVDTSKGAGYRQFHNEVKRQLLTEHVKEKYTVIDFAIGRGGDLIKLKKASFLLGIDIDEKSLVGRNGACDRYLNMWGWTKDGHRQTGYNTHGIFVQGNSTLNIQSGEGITQEYHKCVVRSLFGLDPKRSLGTGVNAHYGRAKNGFNVASIQFAVHYMFKDITTLTHFLQNVAECVTMHGVFVGTCYDGQTVFDLLHDQPVLDIREKDRDICTITKKYTSRKVVMDSSCLGYTIDVLQTEMKKEHQEWLVFFPYFETIMKSYGFELIARIPFEQYYRAANIPMTESEQKLSFLNTTFAFRKVRAVFAPAKLPYIDIPTDIK